jgi:hypothetical protein
MSGHPDDEFHPAPDGDPEWTETCWFIFTVPERRLSWQLYPFFKPTLGVVAGGAYFWDDTGWHLPLPAQPLSDLALGNGTRYQVNEPERVYRLAFDDPDGGDEVSARLTFTGVHPAAYLGTSHLDQPGRYTGTLVLHGETTTVDAYGFRDRLHRHPRLPAARRGVGQAGLGPAGGGRPACGTGCPTRVRLTGSTNMTGRWCPKGAPSIDWALPGRGRLAWPGLGRDR